MYDKSLSYFPTACVRKVLNIYTTRVQKISWNDDGTPDFGVPVSTSEEIPVPSGDVGIDPLPEFAQLTASRFRSYRNEHAHLRHSDSAMRVESGSMPVADSQFIIVAGLADPAAVSIESVNFPGFYVRQHRNSIVLQPDDGTEGYNADATWWIRPGKADSSWISFESYAQPEKYISQRMGSTALMELNGSAPVRAREDATFLEERVTGE